jgi:hypothetical protein
LAAFNRPDDMQILLWFLALLALALLGVALAAWLGNTRHRKSNAPLPTEWALTPRPVFSAEERRVYRLLREALPHHIVLSKLPLVRFCQPSHPNEVRYWFELLGSIHVTFAVCSANGRVLAAIDLDHDRGATSRVQQIKHAVLNTCRVRYLRCPMEHLPSVAELQLLVPQSAGAPRGPLAPPVAPPTLHQARDTLASTVANRRAARGALWQDSSIFQDSFFAPDNRSADGFAPSEFSASQFLDHPGSAAARGTKSGSPSGAPSGAHDIVGVVIDRGAVPSR